MQTLTKTERDTLAFVNRQLDPPALQPVEQLDDPIEFELRLRAWWRGFRRIVAAGCRLYAGVAGWILYGPPSW